ncbi:hypothetical protein EVAR_98084_1 [Eumeta japonica]|uniref:Histone-lysine N-methyltransferase SETMAR n=1 Tax=Eumeta variegata TaxID=151549 RepID=A0A4C1WDB4_EUMVA|nr:hypothetical protein EVAR_98084_1 [Eumeta japonica]
MRPKPRKRICDVYGLNAASLRSTARPKTLRNSTLASESGLHAGAALAAHASVQTLISHERTNLCNEFRDVAAVNNKNIDAVRRVIKTDRHVNYHEIWASLGLDMSQMQSILHKHLGMKKLCSRWIPHNLTEAQKTDPITRCNAMLIRFKERASNSGHSNRYSPSKTEATSRECSNAWKENPSKQLDRPQACVPDAAHAAESPLPNVIVVNIVHKSKSVKHELRLRLYQ